MEFSNYPLHWNCKQCSNLIDNSTSQVPLFRSPDSQDAQIGVKDNDASDTYPAGTWAGYRIATTGLLGVSIAASVTISTYNNVLAEKIITNSGLSIKLWCTERWYRSRRNDHNIAIRWNQDWYQSLVAVLFTATIYHPVVSILFV